MLNTKEGKKEITDISVSQPFKSNKPWVVYKTLKWGTWPFNDKEEDEILFSISDEDLEGLDEYKDFKKQKTN